MFKRISSRFRSPSLFLLVASLIFPYVASQFQIDVATQVLLSSLGAIGLMLLTGYAGQISLGHAGLIAAGAFFLALLTKKFSFPASPCLIGGTFI